MISHLPQPHLSDLPPLTCVGSMTPTIRFNGSNAIRFLKSLHEVEECTLSFCSLIISKRSRLSACCPCSLSLSIIYHAGDMKSIVF